MMVQWNRSENPLGIWGTVFGASCLNPTSHSFNSSFQQLERGTEQLRGGGSLAENKESKNKNKSNQCIILSSEQNKDLRVESSSGGFTLSLGLRIYFLLYLSPSLTYMMQILGQDGLPWVQTRFTIIRSLG